MLNELVKFQFVDKSCNAFHAPFLCHSKGYSTFAPNFRGPKGVNA